MEVKVAAAFAAVYVIWGSTYLAIRFAIETLPPFFMAGARFALAGTILFLCLRLRGVARPSSALWRSAFVVGGLMLLGGHGAVVIAEQWVPSSLTSLLIATVPLWMVFLDSLRSRAMPSSRVVAGVIFGFVGVVLLVGSIEPLGESQLGLFGAGLVLFGAFLWANGSLYSRSAQSSPSQLLMTSMEMFAGGVLLLIASALTGEYAKIRLDLVSMRSMLSWVYLLVFGSLVAFTSYIWLLKKTTPARVSTYAYVNPVVAMLLGWALANETISLGNVLAAVIIITSVIVITALPARKDSRSA